MQRKYIGFFLGVMAFLGILLFADLEPGKPEVTATLAVAALMAIWWVTETVPLAVRQSHTGHSPWSDTALGKVN